MRSGYAGGAEGCPSAAATTVATRVPRVWARLADNTQYRYCFWSDGASAAKPAATPP